MLFAVVLAGGIGKRMGNVDKPKQFLLIGGKPIIVHTIEKFYINDCFEKVIVPCPEEWVSYTEDLLARDLKETSRIAVIKGDSDRNGSIVNALNYIRDNYGIDDDTAVVTHDAVRPFVTQRIIDENVKAAEAGMACDTVIPATDTIVQSQGGEFITSIPNRAEYYHGQTPQSFPAAKFLKLYDSLTADEKSILTDAAKVFVMKGEPVAMIKGEEFNIKVTYKYDLTRAEIMLKGGKNA